MQDTLRLAIPVMIGIASGCSTGTVETTGAIADARKGNPVVDGGLVGGDGNNSPACGASADLFCDDFESYPPGAITSGAKWTSEVENGNFTIDTSMKIGQQSLKIHTNGNGRALANITGFSPPGNRFFGRMQLWMTAFPSAPQYAHWTMFETAGAGADRIRPIGGQFIPGQGSERLWGPGADGGATGDWTQWKVTAPAESGKWVCLEWQVDGPNNAMHVWIDGATKPELDVDIRNHGGTGGEFKIPVLTKAWFGWWLYQGNPTPAQFDMYIDNVAIGTTRQNC